MAHKFLSTIAKRKKMAALVARVASDCLNHPIELKPSDLHPGEFDVRIEGLETDLGPLRHLCFSVCPRGVDMHSQFAFRQFAPSGSGLSGKYNHYIWPDVEDDQDTYAAWVTEDLQRILSAFKIVNAVRADRPSMADYWLYERKALAVECEARAC